MKCCKELEKLSLLKNKYLLWIIAIGVVLVLIWISLFTGVKDIHYSDLSSDSEKMLFFLISRIPRTLALILVGAGLSISGFILQQLSQNRFVSPTTSGSLEAAKMGILTALILFPQSSLTIRMIFALLFTFFTSFLFIYFISKIKLRSTVFIPLVGLMFGSILSAISTFFAYEKGIVQSTQEWLLGDFSSVMQGQYEAIYIILPAVILVYLFAERFTIAGMGESFAKNLGLSYNTIVYIGLFTVSIVVSSSVLTVGAIPFLGLIIPNLVSMVFGDNLRKILPIIAYVGAVFLIVCDLVSRLIVFPYEVPIGMTVGIIGGIVFLILILKKK
ncbi:ABC transporter permease [Sphingobacterium mizutaii]|uniref:ABC transporter permease n=1 Tax=Sphingobacterium mizutaii TaxID=1010 RepID=UPI001EEECFB1|nr:iron chelate uptake ABC transporter family permease subunit [Sphingobacterium mizutaii]